MWWDMPSRTNTFAITGRLSAVRLPWSISGRLRSRCRTCSPARSSNVIEGQRLGRRVAEELFAITYDRLLDFYCKTPEEHYLNLIDRYPGLVDVIPLKELASFIGVTPETVSHIRRKLSSKRKS